MKRSRSQIVTVVVLCCLIAVFYYFDLGRFLNLDELKRRQSELQELFSRSPVTFVLSFAAIYISCAALSIPGATVLTLASGFIFGLVGGTIFVSICSTVGATLAFLVSRFLLRDFVSRKFSSGIQKIDAGIQREGAFYLLALRLVPVFPFFMVNLAMGLTSIRVMTYAFVSQIGMLAGTIAYVNAGTQLSQISSLKGLLSPQILLSFAFIGVLPLVAKGLMNAWKNRRLISKYKAPKKFEYNIVVIGAGSGGLVSSLIAAAVNAKVALIEKHKMGGDCLNTGCVPSKALIRSAKIYSYVKAASEFGIDVSDAKVDFRSVMERVQNVIRKIEPHDSVERYTSMGVECVTGEAEILSPYEVRVGQRVLTAKNIIIATGARPLVPPIPGLIDDVFYTSDTIWSLREQPKRLLVLGGGPIGCELAQAFARLGSKVIQVEKLPRLMMREDPDVSEFVTQSLRRDGVEVLTGYQVKSFGRDGSGRFVICDLAGVEKRIDFDDVLLALGRKPNVTGFGLEKLGVKIAPNGTIEVNDRLQTNYPNMYACGDVAGPFQFTHMAAHQAWFASVNALFKPFKMFKINYKIVPWCTFTDPEVARVGMNELDAKEKGVAFEVTHFDIAELDRAITESSDHGFIKVLTVPGSDKILGATIVGAHAGDIISEYVTAMKYGFGLNKILGTIHIYPTLAEANKYAAGVWRKNHAPQRVLRFLRRFHAWRL